MQELPIHCIVEGLVDEAAVRKLFSEVSLAAGAFYQRICTSTSPVESLKGTGFTAH